ncbi:nicotinate-nucleotide adenylyltransferase [gamma proteobacterium HTCC5015]|nr:nicotinate-nucleotide adenylyltransferase [gamma proteobacterium HTCC5015]
MASQRQRIGVLGGTFDPVHRAHIDTALAVAEQLSLDDLRLIPLGQAVHRDQPATAARHRLAMCRAAAQASPVLSVDDRELRRSGGSYTVLTLEELRTECGEHAALFFLMGQDSFAGFTRWRDPERILDLAHVVVMGRPGYTVDEKPFAERWLDVPPTSASGHIVFCEVPQLAISSTDIRRQLGEKSPDEAYLSDALDANVRKYIRQHSLY